MLLSIKNYVIDYFIKIKTRIDVDKDFYDDDFYLIDMED